MPNQWLSTLTWITLHPITSLSFHLLLRLFTIESWFKSVATLLSSIINSLCKLLRSSLGRIPTSSRHCNRSVPTTIASHHVWLFLWQSHLPRAVVAARTYCCGAESCKLSDTHTKSHKLICPGHGAPQSMAYSFTSVGKFFVYVRGGSLIIWKI
jgi:hypothetical protein